MRIFWDLVYAFDETPWDTGEVPPEVRRVVADGTIRPPGRALDVGCGTGTNVFYLARRGFDTVGVDVSRLAIGRARRRAGEQAVLAEFHAYDVTRLHRPGSPVEGPVDFVLDIGCFHTLQAAERKAYVRMVRHLLGFGGHYMQYAHLKPKEPTTASDAGPARKRRRSVARLLMQLLGRPRPERPDRRSIEESFGAFCRLIWLEEGTEAGRPSAWSLWQRERERDIGWSPPGR